MALPAKTKVSLSVAVVVILLLLLFSAASFLHYSRSGSYGYIPSIRDGRKYQTYLVLIRKRPNGEAMDNKQDARRRWYESFLPSTHTDSGEPRLVHCYTFHVNGFLARLTRAEAAVLAYKPGIRSMRSDYRQYLYSTENCGFETTANMKLEELLSLQYTTSD